MTLLKKFLKKGVCAGLQNLAVSSLSLGTRHLFSRTVSCGRQSCKLVANQWAKAQKTNKQTQPTGTCTRATANTATHHCAHVHDPAPSEHSKYVNVPPSECLMIQLTPLLIISQLMQSVPLPANHPQADGSSPCPDAIPLCPSWAAHGSASV